MSRSSRRRRRRSRAARHGHGRGRGKRWIDLTGPGVDTTEAVMRLFGLRRVPGSSTVNGGDFYSPPLCPCRYNTRRRPGVPPACPSEVERGHGQGTARDMPPVQKGGETWCARLRAWIRGLL